MYTKLRTKIARKKTQTNKCVFKSNVFMFDCTKLLRCQFQNLSSDINELIEISVNKIK